MTSPVNKELNEAVGKLLATAQMTFTTSDDLTDIKQSTDALSALILEWRAHDKRVEATVIGLLRLVQSRCKHVGAQQRARRLVDEYVPDVRS